MFNSTTYPNRSALLTACAALFLSLALAVLALPQTAHAWFNDVTDTYYASQDVNVSGDPIYGNEVPAGVYSITASTSSSMCRLSNVTLTATGSELWVTFTTSGAYNVIYPGTAAEAASLTNEDGTDASNYYGGEPFEGYVPHQFSMLIDALNVPMDIATYTGGKDMATGVWWDRTVVFNSSDEIDEAVSELKETPIEKAKRLILELPDDPDLILSYTDALSGAEAAYDELSRDEQAELDVTDVPGRQNYSYGRHLETAQWGLMAQQPVDNSVEIADGDYTTYVSSSSTMGKSTSPRQRSWSVAKLDVVDGAAWALVRCGQVSTFQSMRVGGVDYPVEYVNDVPQFYVPVAVNGTTTFTVDISDIAASVPYQLQTTLPSDAAPARASLVQATVTGITDCVYTGKQIKPKPTVKVGGKTLKQGTDYKVTYSNNVKVGTGTARITGVGKYEGSITKTFRIKQAKISSIKLSATSHAYTGKVWKPSVNPVKAGKISLAKRGYIVEYSDAQSKDVGNYIVLVYGDGNNTTGMKLASYKITQATNKAAVAKASVNKSIAAKSLKSKAATFALPKVTAKFGKAKWRVVAKDSKGILSLSNGKVMVKKGAKSGSYILKLKASVNGTDNYKGASTKVVTVKVTVK